MSSTGVGAGEDPDAAKPAGQVAGGAGARLAKGFCIYRIPILLPLNDNHGRPHERTLFRAVAVELTGRFGGPARV
jgi:hypothetical protein